MVRHRKQSPSIEIQLGRIGAAVEWKSGSVLGVSFESPSTVTDDTLREHHALFGTTAWLNLAGTRVSDEGLACLVSATKLEHIDLFRTTVTVTGVLSLLERLPKLVAVGISRQSLSEEDVEAIKGTRNAVEIVLDEP